MKEKDLRNAVVSSIITAWESRSDRGRAKSEHFDQKCGYESKVCRDTRKIMAEGVKQTKNRRTQNTQTQNQHKKTFIQKLSIFVKISAFSRNSLNIS